MRAFRCGLNLHTQFLGLVLFGGLSLFAPQASAEYRAFLLQITDSRSGSERLVISTLDELQYRDYYHLHPAESLQRLDTWMCWARSDHGQPICPNPRTLSPEAAASTANGATPPTPTQGPESARPTSGDSLPAPPQL
ncbi:MAG TPA: hypothetical protein PLZ57_11480 [Pseudobdellovibrionaceae bacterium]|nr:hypothetical protein [Pseudobdellovibrionaceae bacterium]